MIICIGPVCVPLWPVLFLALKPIWDLLPEKTRGDISDWWDAKVMPILNPYLDKIPPTVRKFLFYGMKISKSTAERKKNDDLLAKNDCASTDASDDDCSAMTGCLEKGTPFYLDGEEQFASVVQKSNSVPVFLDFTAPWCKPCQTLKPIIEELAKEHRTKALFCMIDIDECGDLAIDLGVSAIPVIQCYSKGELLEKMGMPVTAERLPEFVEKNVKEIATRGNSKP